MITGQWGKPSEVLLDIVVDADGEVHGIVNPGRQNAAIRRGRFDESDFSVQLDGEFARPDSPPVPFRIAGHLDGRTLRLSYTFGDDHGSVELVRVEEYQAPRLSVADRLKARFADIRRYIESQSRPRAEANARRLRERGESLDSIVVRDAVAPDIPALAELHVTTWNATYRTSRGPSVSTRVRQWTDVFNKHPRLDFVVVLEDRNGRLIGFAAGRPDYGEFAGQLSKIHLRWEYHGLGLGRRLMAETARRFLDRGIESFILFAERSNPSIGFYDRMGGERLVDERGLFTGAYAWRDVRKLLAMVVALFGCSGAAPAPDAERPPIDSATIEAVSDTVYASRLSCEGLETDLLSAPPSRAGLRRIHGIPDSIVATTEPNRHVEGAVDSLFTVFYPGFLASFRTPTGARDLIAGATITDNRYVSDPRIGIGARAAAVVELLGEPTRREGAHLVFDCGVVEQPVRFEVRDGRVASISIAYYVD